MNPRKVPIALPSAPSRIAGRINSSRPRLLARASALVLPMLFSPGIALGAMFWQGAEGYWWAMLLLPTAFLFLFTRLILAGAERQLRPRE